MRRLRDGSVCDRLASSRTERPMIHSQAIEMMKTRSRKY